MRTHILPRRRCLKPTRSSAETPSQPHLSFPERWQTRLTRESIFYTQPKEKYTWPRIKAICYPSPLLPTIHAVMTSLRFLSNTLQEETKQRILQLPRNKRHAERSFRGSSAVVADERYLWPYGTCKVLFTHFWTNDSLLELDVPQCWPGHS